MVGEVLEAEKIKGKEQEQLVIGVGFVQNLFWRFLRFVFFEVVKKQLDRYRGKKEDFVESFSVSEFVVLLVFIEDVFMELQFFEIEEGGDGIFFKSLLDSGNG